ncbi:helix-turn-helix domain-containing protein [Gordonia zhaorongruii]|uniref:helix-turn-helix domain-containing protein n=1 Tax=Gordonia zhaorongruii TaxID=2597659 RepID=UPI001052557A|nr:XRE family transcriptional regulator [Gordonia zhaorongruii]
MTSVSNNEDDGWISRRIARMRHDRGWTLATLSSKVNLSSTQLSRIESGARQPSVGTLIEIARAFGVSLSELVADEPTRKFHIVRADERSVRKTASGHLTPLSGNYPALEAIHLAISSDAPAPSAQHSGEEWLYVLVGAVEVTVEGVPVALNTSDAMHFPSRGIHSVRCLGEETAEVILVSATS